MRGLNSQTCYISQRSRRLHIWLPHVKGSRPIGKVVKVNLYLSKFEMKRERIGIWMGEKGMGRHGMEHTIFLPKRTDQSQNVIHNALFMQQ